MITKVANIIKEYSVRNKENEEIPVYSVTNDKGFCTGYFNKDVSSKDKTTYKIVPRGYFAYNPSRINVGSVDWQNCEEKVIVSPLYVVFSIDADVDQQYFLYYLKSDVTQTYIKELATGSVRDNLKISDLGKFPIKLIPLDEQKKVVAHLDLVYSLIKQRNLQLQKLDELVKSRFVEMFGDPVSNPKEWDVVKIGDIATEVKYGTSLPAVEGGKYPYLRMNNMTNDGHLDLSNLKYIDVPDDEIEKCIVRKGDVLFNRTNSVELVGKTCVFDLDEEMIIAGYIIRVRLHEAMLPIVFSSYMNTVVIKQYLRKIAKGAVNQANINAKELQAIQIYLPPLDLQNQFADFVAQVDKSKLAVQKSLEQLEILKKSLMQAYFG